MNVLVMIMLVSKFVTTLIIPTVAHVGQGTD